MHNRDERRCQRSDVFRVLLIGPADEIGVLAGASHSVLEGLGLEHQVAWDLPSAIKAIERWGPQGVVITWSALSSASPDTLMGFRESLPSTGVVAITPDEEAGSKSFWLGTDDFLLPSEVSWRAIRRSLRSSQLQRQFMQDANHQRAVLSVALNIAHAGNWWLDVSLDANGQIVWSDDCYLSPAMKSLVGMADHELENRVSAWKERVHPDDRATLRGSVYHHLNSNSPSSQVEYRVQHKDGRWLHFLSRGKLLRDGLGRPTRLMGVVMDLTSVHEARAGESHYSELVTALIRHSPDAIFLFAVDGTFLAVNEAGAKRFHASPDGLVGKNMFDIISPELAASRREALAEVVNSNSARIWKDVRVGPASESIVFPIPNAQGVVDRFGVIVREPAPSYP